MRFPRQAHPARLRPGPRHPLLASARRLADALGSLPARRAQALLQGGLECATARLARTRCRKGPSERSFAPSCSPGPCSSLGFFSFSSRQEYYSLPALPALALNDRRPARTSRTTRQPRPPQRAHRVQVVPRPALHCYRSGVRMVRAVTAPTPRARYRHRLAPHQQPGDVQPLPRPHLRPQPARHGTLRAARSPARPSPCSASAWSATVCASSAGPTRRHSCWQPPCAAFCSRRTKDWPASTHPRVGTRSPTPSTRSSSRRT